MPASKPTPSEPPLVLIADDDPPTRTIVKFKLQRAGFSVEVVTNGEDVHAIAARRKPRAIVLDVMMPVQDGMTALAKLKRDPGTAAIPVIIFTAKVSEEDERKCRAAGAADFIPKPFYPEDLVTRVRRVIDSTAHAT